MRAEESSYSRTSCTSRNIFLSYNCARTTSWSRNVLVDAEMSLREQTWPPTAALVLWYSVVFSAAMLSLSFSAEVFAHPKTCCRSVCRILKYKLDAGISFLCVFSHWGEFCTYNNTFLCWIVFILCNSLCSAKMSVVRVWLTMHKCPYCAKNVLWVDELNTMHKCLFSAFISLQTSVQDCVFCKAHVFLCRAQLHSEEQKRVQCAKPYQWCTDKSVVLKFIYRAEITLQSDLPAVCWCRTVCKHATERREVLAA